MPTDPKKLQSLRASGTLNPHPERVKHPHFGQGQFLDPHDLVQLKYETVRAVEIEGQPIAQAASQFGLSRPTIYEAQENFRLAGMEGLLPRKRGPKTARKLTPEIRQYLEDLVATHPELKAGELVRRARRRFGVELHPRTVEKAFKKAKRGRQRS